MPHFDLDTMGPGLDNDARRGDRKVLTEKGGRHHKSKRHHRSHRSGGGATRDTMRREGHEGPQATALPGMIPVIHNVQKEGRGIVGVPGIISSTTLGPEVRHRLVAGIIEDATMKAAASGPVHTVMGVDSTAYNEGMVHFPGSRYK